MNPFLTSQPWPQWNPLSLDSVPLCLLSLQFYVQTVRPQNLVEYFIKEGPTSGTSQDAAASLLSGIFKEGLGTPEKPKYVSSREKFVREFLETLVEAQFLTDRAMNPSRALVPKVRSVFSPEWQPMTFKEFKGDGGGVPFPFILLATSEQVPRLLAQTGSGLVCLRSFRILDLAPRPLLQPTGTGILTLVQPFIHVQGLLPITEPPRFPLSGQGPVVSHFNEAWETSKKRDAHGALWQVVEWTPQHPVTSGL